MTDIARIDDEVIDSDEFVKLLKLGDRFNALIEDIIKDKLAVHAARKQGIEIADEELQERADQLRRARGLHRAKDTNRFLDVLGVTLDDFERYVSDMLYKEKLMDVLCSDAAVEEYFQLNSPKFDSVEVSHIVVDSEGKAKEIMYLLEEEPGSFSQIAREHSTTDTRDNGGVIGKVQRGALQTDVEAKVFNAPVGTPLGPFPSADGRGFELFTVNAKDSATLDEQTRSEIRRLIYDGWLGSRARDHRLEAL